MTLGSVSAQTAQQNLEALLAKDKAKAADAKRGASTGTTDPGAAPADDASKAGSSAVAVTTGSTGLEFGCEISPKTSCSQVIQFNSAKDCDLQQPEAVFVTRQGATVPLTVKPLSASELAVHGGTPKPVPVVLTSAESIPITQLPVSGTVVFSCVLRDKTPSKSGKLPDPVLRQFSASLTLVKPAWPMQLLILTPLVLGLLAFAIALVKLSKHLNKPMGAPEWKLADSFLSNVTVGGGLVNGLTALTFFASPVLAEKDTYMLLSFLFAALAGLAPFFYSLTRTPNPKFDPNTPDDAPQYTGAVWSFLAASFFTIWGNAAQIVLFWCILAEFWIAGKLPDSLWIIFQFVNVVLLLLLVIFGVRAMLRIGRTHGERADNSKPDGVQNATRESMVAGVSKWTWL